MLSRAGIISHTIKRAFTNKPPEFHKEYCKKMDEILKEKGLGPKEYRKVDTDARLIEIHRAAIMGVLDKFKREKK